MRPVVSSVHASGYIATAVTVHFKDGHEAIFLPNWEGLGMPRNIVAFRLERGNRAVASFNSQHQYPLCRQPFGFVLLSEGYTVARIAAYWRAAHDHIRTAASSRGRLTTAWSLMWFGDRDLEEIEAGRWPAPASS